MVLSCSTGQLLLSGDAVGGDSAFDVFGGAEAEEEDDGFPRLGEAPPEDQMEAVEEPRSSNLQQLRNWREPATAKRRRRG